MTILKVQNFKTNAISTLLAIFLFCIMIFGYFLPEHFYGLDYQAKNISPSFEHIFGTDFLGRDMFFRTIKGLSLSIFIGILAAFISSVIALILGSISAIFGGWIDFIINWFVDLFMGIPHIVLLILISIMAGGGIFGVIVSISLSHWPSLTRVIRAEVMQVKDATYIKSARKFGKSRLNIAINHIFPHIFPQYLVGLILLFPHAILHEATITFLSFGIPLEIPAVGNILAESMKYLASGKWWLAFFPGLLLLFVVLTFDFLAKKVSEKKINHEE